MTVTLDHVIIPASDKERSARFLADILGIEVGPPGDPADFAPVVVGNGVTLDYMDSVDFRWQHCAFLVSEGEFDGIMRRLQNADIGYFGRPNGEPVGHIYHHNGGRGVYFPDPDGHTMEALTVSYASGLDFHTAPYEPSPESR